MGDLKAKLRAKFTRRNSCIPSVSSKSTHTGESRKEPRPSPLPQPSKKGTGLGPDSGLGLEERQEERSLSRDGGGDGATDRLPVVGANSSRGHGRGGTNSHSGKPETHMQKAATSAGSGNGTPRTPQGQKRPVKASVGAATYKDREPSGPRHAGANQGKETAQGETSETVDVRETPIRTATEATTTWSTDTSSDDDSNISSDETDDLAAPPSARDSTPSSNINGSNSASASGRPSTDTTTTKVLPQNATADTRNDNSSSRPGQTNMPPTTAHDHASATHLANPTPLGSASEAGPSNATSVSRHRQQLSSIEEATDSDQSPQQTSQQNPDADDASVDPLKLPRSTIPATPDSVRRIRPSDPPIHDSPTANSDDSLAVQSASTSSTSSTASPATHLPRHQSLLPSRQNTLIRTLLSAGHAEKLDAAGLEQLLPSGPAMPTRKIWVRRPGGSATMVTIVEEDLVDDVRELILRKYSNSLGRLFDAPDLILRIVPREQQRQERVLGPEEPMARTLDAYFPGGQSVDEALIIDIPVRRTPKASPRNGPPHAQHIGSVYYDDRPAEVGTDYFGPEAIATLPAAAVAGAVANGTAHPHAISVLNTGQVPPIPSPGGNWPRPYRDRPDRPRLGRQHTSSPTVLNMVGTGAHTVTIGVATNHGTQHPVRAPRSRTHSNASSDHSAQGSGPPPAPPLPAPQAPEAVPVQATRAATPPPRAASPRPAAARLKKKKTTDRPPLPRGMLNGGVPPISVLIVEDNIINLRLLEAFVKRLKVRWQTAMNGREAVNKWRTGGFHLVLMDIQLPVMSGLEATREIRRLERMNQIGAFSISDGDSAEAKRAMSEDDILPNREMFKSPVIIVALTASSLQSDRHEALAAGCNDFLTKPVTYVWLERKVMEWGCMQALIDFNGWRKWKDFASEPKEDDAATKKAKAKKNRLSLPNPPLETC